MHLGKAIRLGRHFDDRSGRLLTMQEPSDGQDGTESSTGETEGESMSWSAGGLGKQT